LTHRFPNALSTQVGTQAPLIGVLMRIVSARRMYVILCHLFICSPRGIFSPPLPLASPPVCREDSRLTVLVQGLTRVRILKQTQREPYARATVQVLPDAELTASHYARATTELMVSTYYTPKPSTLETRILSHYCTPLKT
jgi:hypothetical protein